MGTNQMVPWGDAGQPPCGCQPQGIWGWIQENPWLAAAITVGVVWLATGGRKS